MLAMEDPSTVCKYRYISKAVSHAELADLDAFHLTFELSATNNEHTFTAVSSNQNSLSWFANFTACIIHYSRQLHKSEQTLRISFPSDVPILKKQVRSAYHVYSNFVQYVT
jgi:hypothetical protein